VATVKLISIIEREEDGYVAWCPRVADITSRGDSIEQARDNLREELTLFFDVAPGEEVQHHLQDEMFVTQVEVAVG